MDEGIVNGFMANKGRLRKIFCAKHPDNYTEIVTNVVNIIKTDLDVERIHEIDDGGYQGTLVYVIGEKGYQPDDYWYVKIGYGSCSGCDTLESIRGYESETPTEEQVDDYMSLALHIVQGLKKMGDEVVY